MKTKPQVGASASIRNYRQLIVWQKAMTLARDVYRTSARLPTSERFGLTQQLRRSAVSVPSNIAEGQGRMTSGDFARFLAIARGSLHETETLLLLSLDLQFLDPTDVASAMTLVRECSKMLAVMIRKFGRKSPRG
jgi:four helix bundle protein